ncbi:YqcC family protein [Bowmanella sp. JS7-9]|uniref:YqcC family protein n=1 Tax=Pseudobowmanella zhangzhouensis TaxID=1537679 RepID=A0ABW1XJS4_9ALTE|nr:YqcC family protein [Bowmanella sp. JS7-9]
MISVDEVGQLIEQLATKLSDSQLNSQSVPTAVQLASELPFCYDTLHFEQWLEFVFIPRLRDMLRQGQLPGAMQLVPMLEMRAAERPDVWQLFAILKRFDELFAC